MIAIAPRVKGAGLLNLPRKNVTISSTLIGRVTQVRPGVTNPLVILKKPYSSCSPNRCARRITLDLPIVEWIVWNACRTLVIFFYQCRSFSLKLTNCSKGIKPKFLGIEMFILDWMVTKLDLYNVTIPCSVTKRFNRIGMIYIGITG